MGDTFLGGHEPGPHLYAHGSQGGCSHVAAGVNDTSRSYYRDGDGPDHLGHQHHGGNLIDAAQAAAFKPLGDDHVHSLGLGAAGVPHRRHLVDDRHVVLFQDAGEQRRAAAIGDGDVDALLGRGLDQLLYLGVGQVERYAEGLLGQPLDSADHRVEIGDRIAARLNPGRGMQDAQPAGIGYGRNQLRVGHPGHSRLQDRVGDP